MGTPSPSGFTSGLIGATMGRRSRAPPKFRCEQAMDSRTRRPLG
jgi:hypothetical protein